MQLNLQVSCNSRDKSIRLSALCSDVCGGNICAIVGRRSGRILELLTLPDYARGSWSPVFPRCPPFPREMTDLVKVLTCMAEPPHLGLLGPGARTIRGPRQGGLSGVLGFAIITGVV